MAIIPDPWRDLSRLTPARVALGRAGASLPTAETLRFASAHARARDAVHAPFDADGLAREVEALGFSTLKLASAAPDRATYLARPDLGRRLSAASFEKLTAPGAGGSDLAIVIGDGLSSTAVALQAAPLLAAFRPHITRTQWNVAPVAIVEQARVAIADEIAAALGARLVVMLIGERPGLSAADSLGAYVTYAPSIGRTDAERNCISNIREAGLSHDQAAFKLAWLIEAALARKLTGVGLKDESELMLLEAAPPPLPK